MSASQTLLGTPGTASRRSPVSRLAARAGRLLGGRFVYLAPPALALAVLAAVHVLQIGGMPASPPAPPAVEMPARDDAGGDLAQVTDVAPVGAVDTTDTDRRIDFWRERAELNGGSETEWIYIGDLLDLKGRATGDLSQFVAARHAYETAIAIAPGSAAAHAGVARVLATLHEFQPAIAAATKVLQLDPSDNGALAVIFDASVEIGDLANAQRALDVLSQRSDSPAIAMREARLTFLGGDASQAAAIATAAAADADGRGDPPASVALYRSTAAEYDLLAGEIEAAEAGFAAALDALPGYPLALFGHGRAAFARGDVETATSRVAAAAEALPRPDILAFLGDLYAMGGDEAGAADQYATVEFIAQLAADSAGPVYNREHALFLADHDLDAPRAVELAEAELEMRKDVFGYDTLAWALRAAGRHADALEASRTALGLGTVDAKLLIHAGLIELDNGLTAEGVAHLEQGLALRPSISPLVVRAAQEALGR